MEHLESHLGLSADSNDFTMVPDAASAIVRQMLQNQEGPRIEPNRMQAVVHGSAPAPACGPGPVSSAGPMPVHVTAREPAPEPTPGPAPEPTPGPAPAAETSSDDATPVPPIKLGTKPRAKKPVKKDTATKAKAVALVNLKMKKPAAAMHKPRVTHRAYTHAHVRPNGLCTHARADKRATRATCIRFGTRGSNSWGTA